MKTIRLVLLAACWLHLTPAATAAVRGRALLDGDVPQETAIKMNADPKCIALHDGPVTTSLYRVGSDAGLANVFVYIKDAPEGEYPLPSTQVTLSQKGCLYTPQVSGIRVDQTLRIENDDDNLHNVRALARANRPFNIGQPSKGVREKTFKLPEMAIKVKCDVHPWMESYIFVLDHPFFAVTDTGGGYEITGLPAGDYTLVAWHSRLGEQESRITIADDGSASADFSFAAE